MQVMELIFIVVYWFFLNSINIKIIKIINFENNKVVSELKDHGMDGIICIKKIFHPIYGESLLSACCSQKIKLWIAA